jgi:Putative lumazine-binding
MIVVKLSKKLAALTLASAVIAVGVFASTSNASSEAEKEARFVINKYMDAVKNGDVEGIAKYAKDTRFANMEEAKKEYKDLVKQNPVKKAEILNVKQVDENNMVATVRFTQNHVEDAEIQLPMVKENGDWKIVVTGQIVEANAIK